MTKNIKATADGLEFPNANATTTHVNANASSTNDVYLQLPASSGTLALASGVTPYNPYLATYTDSMASPTTLTGSLQTLAEITVGTAGVYELEVQAVAYIEYDPNGSYQGYVNGSVLLVNGESWQLTNQTSRYFTQLTRGSGGGFITLNDSADNVPPVLVYSRDEGVTEWSINTSAPYDCIQSCWIYLKAGEVIRYRALNPNAAQDTVDVTQCTLTARQVWEAPEHPL